MNPAEKLKELIKEGKTINACLYVIELIVFNDRDEEDVMDIILSCKQK